LTVPTLWTFNRFNPKETSTTMNAQSPSPYSWGDVRFPTARKGGFDQAAVNAYVEAAAAEIVSLTQRLSNVVETVAHGESTASEAARVLSYAERIATEVREASEADAAETRRQAEEDARQRAAAARAEAEQILQQARDSVEAERAEMRAALDIETAAVRDELAEMQKNVAVTRSTLAAAADSLSNVRSELRRVAEAASAALEASSATSGVGSAPDVTHQISPDSSSDGWGAPAHEPQY
jgi:cell division septum initiation protein DivIVA